jgi:signal transduction histidine kinase
MVLRVHGAWNRCLGENDGAAGSEPTIGANYLDAWRDAAAAGTPGAAALLTKLERLLVGSAGGFTAECVRAGSAGPQPCWLEVRAHPVERPPAKAVVCHTDISARKRAELSASERLRDLARVSRAVTLGVLSGSLAHELNQPLTAILSNAQAALRLLDGAPPVALLRQILLDITADDDRATAIMRRMRRLLDRREPEQADIDVTALVRSVELMLADEALLRDVRTSRHAEPELPHIRGDPVQLEQVLLNLWLNAFDAMADLPRAERLLEVHVGRCGRDGVEIVVEDRGEGLEAGRMAHIFDPFYTTKRGGMGLGLYLSRTIVEAHGGHIEATNGVHGLRFQVWLPIAAASG